jgi:glycosyltransferase involved in cell wall biosynthesis
VTTGTFELGFACSWWKPKAPTWSFTPISLRQGFIDTGTKIQDIEAQPPVILKAAMAATLIALGQTPWKYSKAYRAFEARRVRQAARRIKPQAVLGLADVVVPTVVPTYAYQDMNFSVAAEYYETFGRDMVSTFPADLDTLRRLADEQRAALEKLDGVFTMSQWYRDHLICNQGLSPNRVCAVGGGISARYRNSPRHLVRPRRERKRILFVGTDFRRKGGDCVFEALQRLNRGGDRELRLTIVGPAACPLDQPLPPWAEYLGRLPRAETAKLFQSHDLFVMPSRFEAYGLTFLEARASGIPCIGRDAFSMPELVQPGVGGENWKGDNIDTLASLIIDVLGNDAMLENCARDAAAFAAENTWESVAERMLHRMRRWPDPISDDQKIV